MRLPLPALLFLAIPLTAADPPGLLARLGSDQFRQQNRVDAICYSPDGNHLATADGDALVIWDAQSGRRLHTIPVANHETFALRYTADGRVLYAAANAGGMTRICRIDPAAGKVLDNRHLMTGQVNGRFSRDGAWLACRDSSGGRLYAVETGPGSAAWSFELKGERCSGFAWRPDGKALAAATVTGRVRIYDPKAGTILHEYHIDGGAVWHPTFSPDGKDLVAEIGSPDCVARFDATTGKVRWKHPTGRGDELNFTADGKAVFYWGTVDNRPAVSRWHWLDADTGEPLGLTMDAEYAHSVAVRPDGKLLAVGGLGGLVSQWDLNTRKRLDASADPPAPVTDLRFTPDGKKVRGWARGWYEWELDTGKQTRVTPRLDVGANEPIAVSHDQKWLGRFARDDAPGAGNQPRRFELVDLKTGKAEHTLTGIGEDDSIRFLADGRLLAIGQSELALIDPVAGRRVLQFERGPGRSVVVSADGKVAAVIAPAGSAARVACWDLQTGKKTGDWTGTVAQQGVLEGAGSPGGGLSPDGRWLVIEFTHFESLNRRATRVGVFDARTGRKAGEWDRAHLVRPVFSPDGRAIAFFQPGVGGIDLREVATGGKRASLFDVRAVDACQFRPDGGALVVATRPGPVEVWAVPGPDRAGPWDASKADQVWLLLAAPEADRAFGAMQRLQALPADAIAFLKARVQVPTGPAAEWVAARVKALDARLYRDREKATAELARAGDVVEGQLRDALSDAPTEARTRLEGLLAKLEPMTPEKLRLVRACEVLEGIGTPEARDLLATWAKGPPGALLTREAADSLSRLKYR
ncbi:MAG TPA: PQQ-binding-like beta-propeller repeat protein [Gemmataceae bacterium]|nr:PQQ-binding-like beta-propeller repeat protein [Gemmataceae bacterium]